MASPQESVTTVNGRRCTRSRARTAATSTSISTSATVPTPAAPTEPSSSAIALPVPTQQTAAGGPASGPVPLPLPPPPPPAPAESSSPVEASAIVSIPTPPVAVSSAAGTGNEVLISLATTPLPTVLQPSAPAPENLSPGAPLQSSETPVLSSKVAAAPTLPPAQVAPTSSDTVETAEIPSPSPSPPPSPSPSPPPPPSPLSSLPSPPSITSPALQPAVTESAGAADTTSVAAVPEILPTVSSSEALLSTTSIAEILSQTGSAALGSSTRVPVGVITPEQGSHTGDGHSGDGHASHGGSDANLGGIVGGVIGGFVALALLSGLLFFCLRRRKSREGNWNEKNEASSGFVSTLKAVPAGFGGLFARLRNEKTGPLDNPYQRHQPRSSVGSVYSTTSSGRGRSINESQGQAAVGGGYISRMSSRKSERNVLRKKTSSVSSQSWFMGITEEPSQNNNISKDPFADPLPNSPRPLRISNPDLIEEESRGPSPPQPAATPVVARDPFASLIDRIDGAPDWLRDSNWTASSVPNHRRTQSSASALGSHPPSSVYSKDPFADPSAAPPLPTQTFATQQPQPPLSTYSAFPAARESNYTFFGEPGPSRPGTNVFTPGLPSNPSAGRPDTTLFNAAVMTPGPLTSTSRLDRQSDPFDLDRPEVLSFKGIMNQMRDSIARTATVRSRRTSSVSNWFGRDASPSGVLNGASVRR